MADLVDDIKAKIGIEELVSQYVPLKKAGRNLKGLCPFHSEKTPSFVVSPEKQICYCFGCSRGGDIFAFIQELESVSFTEALQILGDKAGIKVDASKLEKKAPKGEKDIYFRAHELACSFFEEKLHGTSEGKKVLDYLYKRGLKDETIKEFRIGFAPDSYDSLHPYLLKKGIPKNVLYKSGLVSAKNLADDNIYDKYRARLIFPIFDYFGKVCGFGGRALKKDQAPKYLNSPENLIYNKSKVLYGLSHAKKAVKEKDLLVLVEGYFDVILPYQSGVRNVVATSGIALSDAQAKLIKRLTPNVVTCFDNDDAGFEATKRSYFVLRSQDLNVRTVDEMEGKDPADFIADDGGDFENVISRARDFEDVFVDKLIGDNNIETISGRAAIVRESAPLYARMSPAAGDLFMRALARKLNLKESVLYDEMRNLRLKADHPARLVNTKKNDSSDVLRFGVDNVLFSLLLEYPFLFPLIRDKADLENFDNEFKSIYNELTTQYNHAQGGVEVWDFDRGVLSDLSDKVSFLRLYAEDLYGEFSKEMLENELLKLVDRMGQERRISKLKNIQTEIEQAEKSGDKERLKVLLEEQMREINKKQLCPEQPNL